MVERRWLAVWIVVLVVVALVAVVLDSPSDGTFDAEDAVACGTRVAEELGYPVQTPRAIDRDGTWEVSAAGNGVLLHLMIRAADERITDVEVLRGGSADVLTRDERLVALEGGC